MAKLTYLQLQTRAATLMGESSANADLKSHLLAAVQDIVLIRPWSWTLTKGSDLTLSSGAANLASNFNPKWGVVDARIVNSGSGNDNKFTRILIEDRDTYTTDDYVYWLTWDVSNAVWVFNTLTQTGTVENYYHLFPADASADGDIIIIPDGEAVAYLGASKMWVGDERDTKLQQLYNGEAGSRINNLVQADAANEADFISQGSVIDLNPNIRRR